MQKIMGTRSIATNDTITHPNIFRQRVMCTLSSNAKGTSGLSAQHTVMFYVTSRAAFAPNHNFILRHNYAT